jgi:hypothetical protein
MAIEIEFSRADAIPAHSELQRNNRRQRMTPSPTLADARLSLWVSPS